MGTRFLSVPATRSGPVNELKIHAVNSLKWSALSLGFVLFVMLSLLLSGWIGFQLQVFLSQF